MNAYQATAIFILLKTLLLLTIVTYYFQSQNLEALGASVESVILVSITHRDHYVNIARRKKQMN